MRIWAKIWKNNHIVRDETIEINTEDTRTHKIKEGLSQICCRFDLEIPIWLQSNIDEFKQHSRVKFYQDSFIEEIPFDCLEIQVLEE